MRKSNSFVIAGLCKKRGGTLQHSYIHTLLDEFRSCFCVLYWTLGTIHVFFHIACIEHMHRNVSLNHGKVAVAKA